MYFAGGKAAFAQVSGAWAVKSAKQVRFTRLAQMLRRE
jgi:hypothetical protein